MGYTDLLIEGAFGYLNRDQLDTLRRIDQGARELLGGDQRRRRPARPRRVARAARAAPGPAARPGARLLPADRRGAGLRRRPGLGLAAGDRRLRARSPRTAPLRQHDAPPREARLPRTRVVQILGRRNGHCRRSRSTRASCSRPGGLPRTASAAACWCRCSATAPSSACWSPACAAAARGFAPEQMQVAQGIADLAALALENARLAEELAQTQRLKTELIAVALAPLPHPARRHHRLRRAAARRPVRRRHRRPGRRPQPAARQRRRAARGAQPRRRRQPQDHRERRSRVGPAAMRRDSAAHRECRSRDRGSIQAILQLDEDLAVALLPDVDRGLDAAAGDVARLAGLRRRLRCSPCTRRACRARASPRCGRRRSAPARSRARARCVADRSPGARSISQTRTRSFSNSTRVATSPRSSMGPPESRVRTGIATGSKPWSSDRFIDSDSDSDSFSTPPRDRRRRERLAAR